ncbi:hypothetical protein DPMN_178628 [Dreissena polymorpha]|uniref:Uncharacterized protein n=1 Tax=Dreissena polymorpha TaxID=45954 RepID=A0A9D4EBB1_DREPO|nr:hypothetical protein DPMN_178628 [Dreissena polymorpha]
MMQPPWATEILSEIKCIKDKIKSIDRIEQTLNSIAAKVSDLEMKVKEIDCRVQHTETCAKFLGSKLDEKAEGLSNINSKIKQINKSCTHLEEQYRALEALEKKTEAKLLDLETKSMRNNLVVYGVPEATSAGTEDCT